ncbi:MAG: bifunctional glycosyltransferase family 2/GtrA family protein [Oscillospiraceae bacterium]|nr:bifunctional glycosyltransferase family 2/GtrA family protein [Oscillospiraceae bacterium]
MKVSAIIPSLNPDERLPKVVQSLVEVGFQRIIIVNDGSSEERIHFFEEAVSVGNGACVMLDHEVNKGKGRALKTAFSWFLANRNGDIGVVTLDADGQHRADDVLRCAQMLEQEPDALVVGGRNFDGKDVPLRSRVGNKLTAGVFRFVCGINIKDTQTGLRGISAEFAEILLEVSGERFEFETNMLLESKRRGISIVEIPIATVYIDENKTSHFNPIRDSINIYMLIFKYISSSVISWAVDFGLFALLSWLLAEIEPHYGLLIATVAARVVSSLCNYAINKKVVFRNNSSVAATMAKYYTVAVVQAALSYGGVYLFTEVLGIYSLISKLVVDLVLFLISFKVQQLWVFKNGKKKNG